ncbi:hypothetical protein ACGRSR_17995 [Vibrio owensii]|uniref:hypothetical protein n=1 Tax=Vibrio owensii TaxID=696485 RepID=UPI0037489E85
MLDKIPVVKATFDVGDGHISFYVNGNFVCQWLCDDTDEATGMLDSFIEVFQVGMRAGGKQIAVVGHSEIELVNE